MSNGDSKLTLYANQLINTFLKWLTEESEIISGEIAKLLKKGVIKDFDREKGDFISTFFTWTKKDGDMRII